MFEEKGRFAKEQGRKRLCVITGQSFTPVITVNDLYKQVRFEDRLPSYRRDLDTRSLKLGDIDAPTGLGARIECMEAKWKEKFSTILTYLTLFAGHRSLQYPFDT